MKRILIAVMALAAMAQTVAAQTSNAARYLVRERITEACASGAGSFDPAGIIERDLTGDGRADLILFDHHLSCQGGIGRSQFCGAAACTYTIFVREGDLLQPKHQGLSVENVWVDPGTPPVISATGAAASGYATLQLRWDGSGFR
ncbi:hypothetical protein [Palleronia pelagia]|uniref:FG-GAP repeat-containing protein n=1 Tax=Palleronia pelagia TaxID=387096 RepID=A0A1H8FXB2_9RHOB|nr:hypothetical protein [Palleronia pelagia]SEN35718.1 hypothetical protein SAMN04488011_103487 [Palleronia pelagia]